MAAWTTLALDQTPQADGEAGAAVRHAAAILAKRLGAGLLGLASLRQTSMIGGDGYAVGELMEMEREAADTSLAAAKRRFETAAQSAGAPCEWRESDSLGNPAAWMTTEARGADLIITAPGAAHDAGSASIGPRAADLVMRAGRPVLLAPAHGRPLALGTAVLAWKDSRESRRAAADALPLLMLAERVVVLTIAPRGSLDSAGVAAASVVTWLGRHGVEAEARTEPSAGQDATRLAEHVESLAADVVVAGAYGRPRLSEWSLGGVTSDYLLNPDRCVLLSH
jgi:nucleotide-binding universal stress UspA family protein